MASTAWLSLAGTEVANAERTRAYAAAGVRPSTLRLHDCGCSGLAGMLGDPPYTTPAGDVDSPPAWVDAAEPDSYDFAGFLITDIKGLDAAPVDRPLTQRLRDGAVAGRARYGPRVITVTGLLIAGTCCGLEYGQRWLNSVLAGSLGCGPGSCGGDDLCYFTCCPPECGGEECAEAYYRRLRDVVLTQEPQTISEFGGGCGCGGAAGCGGDCPVREVQFQLTATKPRALRLPVTITAGATWDPGSAPVDCIEWSTDPGCVDEATACAQQVAAPCPLDPACPPPELPQLPIPYNPCQCDPIEGRARLCIDVPEAVAPAWADAVPILRIYAGLADLRSVRIRFYPNPLGRTIEELDPCGFCSELNVSYIPAGGTLTLDGTSQRGLVQCPGRADTPAGSILAGPQGGPLVWPELECGIAYIVCVEVDAATMNAQARVSLETVVREV